MPDALIETSTVIVKRTVLAVGKGYLCLSV